MTARQYHFATAGASPTEKSFFIRYSEENSTPPGCTNQAQGGRDWRNFLDFIRRAMVWLSDQPKRRKFSMTSRRTALFAGHEATLATQIVLLALALSLLSLAALAQSTAGRVRGSVTDQSGASVAGASVVVTDTQRGTSRTQVTDASGGYVAPDLIPGTYKIHVEAKGFKSAERP